MTGPVPAPNDAHNDADFRCGTAAIVGRPNVGKSTLVNALVGQRFSIAGPKPQTTRHRILGIVTRAQAQILLLDTPGLHSDGARAINRQLNRAARNALSEADVCVHLIEAGRWTLDDQLVRNLLAASPAPKLLVLNKVDAQKDKKQLLPFLQKIGEDGFYAAIFLISARRRDGIEALERAIIERLPMAPAQFGEDQFTDRSERFLAAELIREQLMLRLGQELPYAATVEIETFTDSEDGVAEINAAIWVEREGQKAIVIGKGGEQLKIIGSAARQAMIKLFGRRVFLKLWVKVRENWSDDEAALQRFGYAD
jgi:GTP-binding protein Era